MATNTMVALATYTAPSTQSSYTFTGISNLFTDLQLVVNGSLVSAGRIDLLVGNGSVDTTATYSNTELLGNGSTPNSYRNTGTSTMQGIFDAVGTGTGVFQFTANFMSYANTNTYRTILGRYGAAGSGVGAMVGTWRNNTQAINTIQILPTSSFSAGTTFTLYGIAAQPVATAKATGGTITYDVGYTYHTFTTSGTFTPSVSLSCDVMVIGGGGAGGATIAGGGGAGGFVLSTGQSISSAQTITVGSFGAGTSSLVAGGSGTGSSIGSLVTAAGGGGGGEGYDTVTANNNGVAGASGGGGSGSGSGNGGAATPSGQGYAGAGGSGGGGNWGGGGGGAGSAGSSQNGGAGAGGTSFPNYTIIDYMGAATSTGVFSSGHYYYASGGGGGARTGNTAGTASVGGGASGNNSSSTPSNALANTGGGGAGSGYTSGIAAGSNGGSGLVIIRYPN